MATQASDAATDEATTTATQATGAPLKVTGTTLGAFRAVNDAFEVPSLMDGET